MIGQLFLDFIIYVVFRGKFFRVILFFIETHYIYKMNI